MGACEWRRSVCGLGRLCFIVFDFWFFADLTMSLLEGSDSLLWDIVVMLFFVVRSRICKIIIGLKKQFIYFFDKEIQKQSFAKSNYHNR